MEIKQILVTCKSSTPCMKMNQFEDNIPDMFHFIFGEYFLLPSVLHTGIRFCLESKIFLFIYWPELNIYNIFYNLCRVFSYLRKKSNDLTLVFSQWDTGLDEWIRNVFMSCTEVYHWLMCQGHVILTLDGKNAKLQGFLQLLYNCGLKLFLMIALLDSLCVVWFANSGVCNSWNWIHTDIQYAL